MLLASFLLLFAYLKILIFNDITKNKFIVAMIFIL